MARKKSELVSAHYMSARIIERLANAVIDLGGSDDDLHRIDLEEGLAEKLATMLMNGPKPEFKTWRMIKLGTGLRTADDFRSAHKRADMKIGDYANDMLGKSAFTASETEQQVELVVASVAELGFKKGARFDQICGRARELGLELCPNEVGPQLRLQYTDQPMNEWLLVAMEPIFDSDGYRSGWRVGRGGGGLWLDGTGVCFHPGSVWDHDDRFVFVRRKSR